MTGLYSIRKIPSRILWYRFNHIISCLTLLDENASSVYDDDGDAYGDDDDNRFETALNITVAIVFYCDVAERSTKRCIGKSRDVQFPVIWMVISNTFQMHRHQKLS